MSLNDPVSMYGINLSSPPGTVIRVRHLMSHTSEGTPGTQYAYNGDRFSLLDAVVAQAEGKPFAHHMKHLAVHGFLHVLGYDHESDEDADAMERLERTILARLGVPDPYLARDAEG